MSHLTDLLARVKLLDEKLGEGLENEFEELSKRRAFGLNFERHQPENIELYGRPVRRGDKVHLLPPRGSTKKTDQGIFKVLSISENTAQIMHLHKAESEPQEAKLDNLVPVAESEDIIYPGLMSTGKVERGGDKPFHTVINGENLHALEALTYTHRGKIDAIYIDPPYNKPNAKDWKYNNDYVDAKDSYRHSKWLAMVERRLKIAKKLLNPDKSILIVTIDEKEYLRLGLLLEQLFSGNKIQMISSNINPSGVARERQFYRVDEYIFFVFIGEAAVIEVDVDGLCVSSINKSNRQKVIKNKKVRWGYLRRSGTSAQREDSKKSFYPILIDTNNDSIVSAGETLPIGKHPEDYSASDGLHPVWPIRKDGSEGRWQVSRDSFGHLLKLGYIKLGLSSKAGNYSIIYLTKDLREKLSRGEIVEVGKDKFGGIVLEYLDSQSKVRHPKTQWSSKAHSATDHGSSLIPKFIPQRKFSFPKSLYAVEDTLRFFIADNPDAIVLDFFAGSGTTAHAVMRLNRQDNGRRQSISITNNEVSDREARAFRKRKLRPGDLDWEKLGICEYITKPRIKAAITGKTPDGNDIDDNYKYTDKFPMVEGFEENAEFFNLTYETPIAIEHNLAFGRIAPLLWMKAGSKGKCIDTVSSSGWAVVENYGILHDLDYSTKFCAAIMASKTVRIAYIVTDDEACFQSVAQALPNTIEAIQLHESYISNFRFKTGRGT